MNQGKIIKRYANRKLYDVHASRYISFAEIERAIKKDIYVRVTDNVTGKDVTSLTLTQILFQKQKRNKQMIPVQLLRNLIAQ